MNRLDRTEQRITGVLIEKQLSVPDSYPMSENALVDGCNQKNNRDPLTELATFQVAGALMALQEKGFVARVEGGGRVAKYKHRVVEQLQVDTKELAILAELLVRGPQASGALKTRVARMGNHASPEEIDAMLRRMGERKPPLVELLPLGHRERDRRWRHLIGDGSEMQPVANATEGHVPSASAAASHGAAAPPAAPAASTADLERRITTLEQQMAALQAEFRRITTMPQGD